jgi:pyruvate/2-oxoglutarate dehydrogenase complex dihydrolipoamide dehydrogenase (E3) component
MKIVTGATVKTLAKADGALTAILDCDGKSQQVSADRIVVAVGIVGNTESFGLDGLKVRGRSPARPASTPSAGSQVALARAQGDSRGRRQCRAHRRGERRRPSARCRRHPGLH